MIARHGTDYHVCRSGACRRDNRADKQRSYTEDDCLIFKGRLPPEQGALIVKALEMAMDRDFTAQNDVSAETPNGSLYRNRTFKWQKRLESNWLLSATTSHSTQLVFGKKGVDLIVCCLPAFSAPFIHSGQPKYFQRAIANEF